MEENQPMFSEGGLAIEPLPTAGVRTSPAVFALVLVQSRIPLELFPTLFAHEPLRLT